MVPTLSRCLWLLYAAALVLFHSCDSSTVIQADAKGDEQVDHGTSEDLGDEGLQDGGSFKPCDGLPDLTGRAYVATKLVATKPTKEVNPIWANDIKEYNMVLIFYVVSHDVETGEVTMEVTSASVEKGTNPDGTVTPKAYRFGLEPSRVTAQFDGCGFRVPATELDIQATTVSKPFHAFGITGQVSISNDGTKFTDVGLKGGIKEDSAYDLCMATPFGYLSFHWFMNLAKICPDWDSDGDGTIDSYRFEGHISAVQTDLFHRDKIVPIIPPEGECKEDKEPCR